ncbi:hybrid sensor histidine kinase/response regulator transcription factor [Haliscomenobacter hydrossis]|nr:two-component regulator propeller domain-containing protein [Haliscomenobacter hydrossis]
MKQPKTPLTVSRRSSVLCMVWMLLIVLIRPVQGFAQVPFESISIQQGLSQGMIYDILQDREGFLWFGTKDGLNRFDGYNLKVFTNDTYDPHSLSSNSILKLFEDHKGRIWIVTDNEGLNVYDKKTGRFQRIQYRSNDPLSLSSNQIRCIAEDAAGNILVAADAADLNVIGLADDFFEKNTPPKIRRLTLPHNLNVTGIAKDSQGRVWMGGDDRRIYQLDPQTFQLRKAIEGYSFEVACPNSDGTLWASDQNHSPFHWDGKRAAPLFENLSQVLDLQVAPDGKLWLIKGNRLYGLDLRQWKPGKPLKWHEEPFFSLLKTPLNTLIQEQKIDRFQSKVLALDLNAPLTSLAIDRSGMVLVGTHDYGVYKFNPDQHKFRQYAEGISIRRIIPAPDGSVYLDSYRKLWYQLRGNALKVNGLGAISSQVSNVLITRSAEHWALTNTDLVRFRAGGTPTHIPITAAVFAEKQPILEDQQGNVWLAGLEGALARVDPRTNQVEMYNFADPARPMQHHSLSIALYEGSDGLIWIGTLEGFVKADFSKTKPHFHWYRNKPNERNSLSYNYVTGFLDDPLDPQRYLWICTRVGLNRLDKKTGDFLHLSTADGLPNNVVYGLLADAQGNLWGSTNRGIFCLSQHIPLKDKSQKPQFTIRSFSTADGLQHQEFNTGALAKFPNGELAFGGVNGFNVFDPKSMLGRDYQPRIFITNISVNNHPVMVGDDTGVLHTSIETTERITLNHLQDILSLEYAALDYTGSMFNKYRYQLVGADPDWIEAGTRRSATYLHLPPGSYTFRVQGSNSRGIWSPHVAKLNIKILPPWWRSRWAYLGYLLLLTVAGRALFHFYLNREKLKAQLAYETREATRIKELDTAKTRLYTNITHEFRTPLTVILGMAQQTLEKPSENLAFKQEMILRNGQQLLQLVNEMLDLSRLESGKMALRFIQGDVIAFLRYMVESFHSLAESQQKQLHFLSTLQELDCVYDPEKLRQIVSNLLSNALKFTPESGNIYLSIDRSFQNEKPFLQITVKDTGIGIPEQQLPHIFDRFYQVDDSPTRQGEGAGIGLALTKELVNLLQGEIRVKSPVTGSNKGAEFTVLLPLQLAAETIAEGLPDAWAGSWAATANPQLATPTPLETTYRQLILLVEDNPDVAAYLHSCLPEYRLEFAKDGLEGFDKATELIPDLIISDVMMPRMDGFTLCQHLRNDERSSHIPIILLTAKADFESKLTGLDRGADAYLEKPFQPEELRLRIKKLLELREKLKQHYLQAFGLRKLAALEEPALEKSEDSFVQKIRECIEANLSDHTFSVEQLCKAIHLSQRQLQRKLEALTGFSPNQFIRSIRLNHAKILLRDPELSITAVAYDCGFSDPSYFARVFKQEFGITPVEWRGKTMSVI